MAARQRRVNESFKKYRLELKKEDALIKAYLSRRYGQRKSMTFLAWLLR